MEPEVHVDKLFSKVCAEGLEQNHIDYLNKHDLSEEELKYVKRQLKAFCVENKYGLNIHTLLTAIVVGTGSIALTLLNIFINDTKNPVLEVGAAITAFVLLGALIFLGRRSYGDVARFSKTMREIEKLTKEEYQDAFFDIMLEYRR